MLIDYIGFRAFAASLLMELMFWIVVAAGVLGTAFAVVSGATGRVNASRFVWGIAGCGTRARWAIGTGDRFSTVTSGTMRAVLVRRNGVCPRAQPIPMTGDELDKAHAKQIADALFPSLNYLLRLKRRMFAKGFAPGDPLLVLVESAYDATQRLYLDLLTRAAFGKHRPVAPKTEYLNKATGE